MDSWGFYDYQGVGKSRLTSYLQKDGQPQRLAEAMLAPFRDLERLHHALFDMLNIYKATGVGLDAFGEMVHILRLGRDDDDYRQAILTKRFSSGGSGTWEEIKRALRSIGGTGAKIRKCSHFPASYVAIIWGTKLFDKSLPKSLFDLSVAGVHGYAAIDYAQTTNPTGSFELSGVAGSVVNALGAEPTASGNDDTAVGYHPGVNTIIAVNSSAGTLGGTPLAGVAEFSSSNPQDYGSRRRGAYVYGTFPDYQP